MCRNGAHACVLHEAQQRTQRVVISGSVCVVLLHFDNKMVISIGQRLQARKCPEYSIVASNEVMPQAPTPATTEDIEASVVCMQRLPWESRQAACLERH
jgi:hypothetical protein